MKAYAIVIHGNEVSTNGFSALKKSLKDTHNTNVFELEQFDATTPEFANVTLMGAGLTWTYPWEGETIDFKSGLALKAYPTAYRERRIACFMSHYRLWHECMKINQPILILEHDATFVHRMNEKILQFILDSKYDIIGINNPLMATRRAQRFFDIVKSNNEQLQPVPAIDEFNIPQGLAGNSAYIIKPAGAKALLEAAEQYGAWPNDALMCKQLIPNMGVTRVFYTKVQGLPSTTTG